MKRGLPSAVAIVGAGLVIVGVFLPFGVVSPPFPVPMERRPSFNGLAFNEGKLMLGFALVGLMLALARFWVSKRSDLGRMAGALVACGLLIGGFAWFRPMGLDREVAVKALADFQPSGFEAMRGVFEAQVERYVEIKSGYYMGVGGAVMLTVAGLWAGVDWFRGNRRGDDWLNGGKGSDTANGGRGTDRCAEAEDELGCEK